MKYLWDTDVVISFLRGEVAEGSDLWKMLRDDDVAVSIITYGELEVGVQKSDNPVKERKKLGNFFDVIATRLDLDLETIQIYAGTRVVLEKKGSRIDDFDLLIASTAIKNNRTLVSYNVKHFGGVPGLKIWSK